MWLRGRRCGLPTSKIFDQRGQKGLYFAHRYATRESLTAGLNGAIANKNLIKIIIVFYFEAIVSALYPFEYLVE